jgi:hypothetical protein
MNIFCGSYMIITKWNNKRISLYGSYMSIMNEIINEYLYMAIIWKSWSETINEYILWVLYENLKMK